MNNMMKIFVVFLGGIFGGLARYELNDSIPKIGIFPLGTIVINLLGCFLFALIVKRYLVAKNVSEKVILAVGTGFFGAFTTFSSATLDAAQLMNAGHFWMLLLYFALELIGGLSMIALGLSAGRRWFQK